MINALINRSNYPSLNDYVYLNQASLGLIGQPAVQSMHSFLDNIARHGNLRMNDEEEVGFFESLRQRSARLLNCHTDRLAILSSASELLGQLPFLIRPRSGSFIVAVSTDFPAVTQPWIRYAAENDCSLRFVDGIDSRTTVVAVSSVQFSKGPPLPGWMGTTNPLDRHCRICGCRLPYLTRETLPKNERRTI